MPSIVHPADPSEWHKNVRLNCAPGHDAWIHLRGLSSRSLRIWRSAPVEERKEVHKMKRCTNQENENYLMVCVKRWNHHDNCTLTPDECSAPSPPEGVTFIGMLHRILNWSYARTILQIYSECRNMFVRIRWWWDKLKTRCHSNGFYRRKLTESHPCTRV